MERLNPLNDFLFKKLFADEKEPELLIGLLNAILDANILEIKIEKENLDRILKEDKLGVLDIKAKTAAGEKFNIEVQLLNPTNMIPRTLFYWSKLFVEDFKAGSAYKSLQKTVTINILGFKLEELRNESFHSAYKLKEIKSSNELTDLLEIHFVEFPKFAEIKHDLNNPMHRRLLFLKKDVPEDTLREVTSMDVSVNRAEERLLRLSADPETRREYEQREKALSDERSRMEGAKEEGIEEGFQKGIHIGIETGILDVVKKLLESGMPLEEAAKFTPYSANELQIMLK